MANDRELDARGLTEGLAQFDADMRRGMIRGPLGELLPWSVQMTPPYGTAASAESPPATGDRWYHHQHMGNAARSIHQTAEDA